MIPAHHYEKVFDVLQGITGLVQILSIEISTSDFLEKKS